MYENIFREYDIRGIFGEELNEASVKAIGLSLGREMARRGVKSVSVGYDARLSANEVKSWLVSGLNAANLSVFDISMLPTPVGYFSVFTGKFDANVMITGSHNPKNYNGFKITIGKESFFGEEITKLGKAVNEILQSGEVVKDDFRAQKVDVLSEYVEFYRQNFSHLKGLKTRLVFDCGNGVAGISLVPILKAIGVAAEVIFAEPDGNFPNHHPDPSEEKNLTDLKAALKGEFEVGIGFDGDADRVAVLTKKRVIKGDELAYLYALKMKNPRVLGEVKCSQNMYDEINKIGEAFMGKTGHSNIKKAMSELNIDMAAEVSGHIFFKERFFGFDDGVYAAIRVLELLQSGIDLDAELDKLPPLVSTDELKIATTDEKKFEIIAEFKRQILQNRAIFAQASEGGLVGEILEVIDIDGVRLRFKEGWALLRASNTSPVLVTRFEGKRAEFVAALQERVTSLVKQIQAQLG